MYEMLSQVIKHITGPQAPECKRYLERNTQLLYLTTLSYANITQRRRQMNKIWVQSIDRKRKTSRRPSLIATFSTTYFRITQFYQQMFLGIYLSDDKHDIFHTYGKQA
jgi:predicted transposase YdaD